MPQPPSSIHEVLDRIDDAAQDQRRVSVGQMLEAVGRRSFGTLLVLVGVVLVSPLSGIPGMPTSLGLLVALVAVQLLAGRRSFWMPGWILRRSISHRKLDKATSWLERPARVVDRWLRPRLPIFVSKAAERVTAVVTVGFAVIMPIMELLPFSASAVGVALTAFGLGLTARDGLFSLVAFGVTVLAFGLALRPVLG